jgi:hypothetical protein
VNLTAILFVAQPIAAVVLLVGGVAGAAIGMSCGLPVWNVVLLAVGVVAAAVGIALLTSCGEGSR